MQYHYILTDRQLEVNFEHCLLHPKFFTHEAHLRLAWIHIRKYGVAQAILNLCDQISQFDRVFGTNMKYNASMTIASVKLIGQYMEQSYCSEFKEFIGKFPELMFNFKELLEATDPVAVAQVMEEYR